MKKNVSIQKVLFGLAAIIFLVACDKDETSTPEDLIYYQKFSVTYPDYIDKVISYDVDGDLVNDLEITTTFKKDPLAQDPGVDYKVEFNCINKSMEFCQFKLNEGTDLAYMKFNEAINLNDIFMWMKTYDLTGHRKPIPEDSYYVEEFYMDYFTFKIKKENKIYFGWFRMRLFEIQEIAVSKIANKSIRVGQKE